MADKKPEYQTHAQITSGRGQAPSAQTPAQPVVPVLSNQSGKVPTSDYLRLLAATGLRVGGPMLGQILGAPIPLPGTAEAGGALGGGLGEYLAEKVEPNNPTHETNKGRIATSAALGAVPGSWIFKAGNPLASAIRGGALSAAGIGGNKLAEGTPITDWSSNDLLNVGVGAGIGGGLGMIGGPKTPPPAPKPVIDPAITELTSPSGLRIAAQKLAQRPAGAPVTPGVRAAHSAVAHAIETNPTGPLAQEVIGPKGVPKKPSINEMDILHAEANADQANMTPEQKRAYAESKTEQGMLLKAQKFAEKTKLDKSKAQLASGTEQSRAIDKQVKAKEDLGKVQGAAMDQNAKIDEASRKMRGAAEDQNLKIDAQRGKVQGQALEENKKFDAQAEKAQIQEGTSQARGIDAAAKRATAEKAAANAATQQAEINTRKSADGVVATTSPVVESIKGVGPNGEPQSSRTTYVPPDPEAAPVLDESGQPVTPPAPHDQNYFTKGDALKAAKKANEAAVARGEAMPYDPKQWNVVEIPGGGARIAAKGEGRSNASPALTKALEAEEGGASAPVNPVAQSPDALYKTVHPDDFKANGIPPEGVAAPPANPNAAAIAELEQETKINPLPGGTGPVPATEPLPPAPGPISREQFGAVNGEPPTQAPLPLEPPTTQEPVSPPIEPVAPVEPPVPQAAIAPPADLPPTPSVGGEGQPLIPFRSQKEAAGSGFGSILDARRSGEVVPDDAIGTASKAYNRIKTESPITAEEAAAILANKRASGTWDAAIRRGLASGDLPKAPKMDAIRPDITGPEGEMGPEIPIEPKEDGGTTLSAFGGGQGANIMDAIRNNPMLAARLGLGAAGAGLGSMTTPDDPLKGAIVGGGIGAALPSAGKAIGNVDWSGLAKRLPDIERFGYLSSPNGLAANMIGAPTGLGATTGMEKYLEGVFSGSPEERARAIALLKNLPGLPTRWKTAMAEAGQMLSESPENIGDMQYTPSGSGAKAVANRVLSLPSQGITGAHVALRDAAIDAGYPRDLSTEFALGNDPSIGSGNQTIRAFGKGLQNDKATQLENGTKNTIMSMLAPFTRTAANVAAATPTRTPGLGLLLKAANMTEESWPAIVAQQGVGGALSGAAYLAGENMDPETAKYARKWIRNMGGRYGLVTTVAFELGQAAREGKSKGSAFTKGVVGGLPMPTTEPVQDILNAGTSLLGGEPQLPGAFVPGMIKDKVPKEYMTKRTR